MMDRKHWRTIKSVSNESWVRLSEVEPRIAELEAVNAYKTREDCARTIDRIAKDWEEEEELELTEKGKMECQIVRRALKNAAIEIRSAIRKRGE